MRQSIINQLAMGKQSHALQSRKTSRIAALFRTQQMAHVLKKKKKKSRQQQRAIGPTYKAGLPACTQGAVGRVVTGLRVGGKIKGQTKKYLSKNN